MGATRTANKRVAGGARKRADGVRVPSSRSVRLEGVKLKTRKGRKKGGPSPKGVGLLLLLQSPQNHRTGRESSDEGMDNVNAGEQSLRGRVEYVSL